MHGCLVLTEHAEVATVSRGTSRVQPNGAVSTPLPWIFKNALYKANHLLKIICDTIAVSLLESGE